MAKKERKGFDDSFYREWSNMHLHEDKDGKIFFKHPTLGTHKTSGLLHDIQ